MSDDDLIRVHLWVTGRVQGVFFRASTADEARALGLTGWVRNAPDRRVEIEVQGPRSVVDEFVRSCRAGPPMARVTDVEVEPLDPVPSERRFEIVA